MKAALVIGTMAAALALSTGAQAATERVEISGPIFPKVLTMYQYEGANYPTTLEAQTAAAHDSALTFPALLPDCAPHYPEIKLGSGLTSSELTTNYDKVAQCSYERYTAKPYWIPQLVSDVDICANELGSDWRLIAESDLVGSTALDEASFQFVSDTLTTVSSGTSSWGSFYFSLHVYVRGADGTVKHGNMEPGASVRVESLGLTPEEMKMHLLRGYALRCIRRATVTGG